MRRSEPDTHAIVWVGGVTAMAGSASFVAWEIAVGSMLILKNGGYMF